MTKLPTVQGDRISPFFHSLIVCNNSSANRCRTEMTKVISKCYIISNVELTSHRWKCRIPLGRQAPSSVQPAQHLPVQTAGKTSHRSVRRQCVPYHPTVKVPLRHSVHTRADISTNSTRWARPDFVRLGLRQVRGLCLVVDLSVQSRRVRILSMGLVGSQTKSVGPCSGIWK